MLPKLLTTFRLFYFQSAESALYQSTFKLAVVTVNSSQSDIMQVSK